MEDQSKLIQLKEKAKELLIALNNYYYLNQEKSKWDKPICIDPKRDNMDRVNKKLRSAMTTKIRKGCYIVERNRDSDNCYCI